MADAAHIDTDKKIKKLQKNIEEVYSEAQLDIEDKLHEFTEKFIAKEEIYQQKLDAGEITQEQFNAWKKGQVFQGKQWKAKRDQIVDVISHSNQIATKMINGSAYGVFMTNANYTAFELESGAGVNFGFGIYDSATVTKLIKDNPQLLPKWKVDQQKDYVWNKKKVNNAITQGIIQGESLDKISKRLSTGLVSQNENTMRTFARTAMTGAQNAGRDQRLMTAKAKGINVVKQWMATLDGVTRHSHRMMDGETIPVPKDIWHPVKFSNGCRYPGDPEGPAHEVYNCRCTMVGDVLDFPDEYKRYDNIDGKPIKNMTYQEWYKAKYGKELKAKAAFEKSASKLTGIDYSKHGCKEVFDILTKYDCDLDKILSDSTNDEWHLLESKFNTITGIEKAANNAKADMALSKKLEKETKVGKAVSKAKTKELSQVEKLEAQVKATKADLKEFEDNPANSVLFKKYSGIWKDDVTILDYESKKSAIIDKMTYYVNSNSKQAEWFFAQEINADGEKYKSLFYELSQYDSYEDVIKNKSLLDKIMSIEDKDGYAPFTDMDDVKDFWSVYKGSEHTKKFKENMQHLADLNEFQNNGELYKNLMQDYNQKKLQVSTAEQALKTATKGKTFSASAYTPARKDAALWAQTPRDADDALRVEAGKVWNGASKAEKEAIYDYTGSYHKFNEPLRGIEYGSNSFLGIGNTDLNASYANNGPKLNALTDLLNKAELPQDQWFQRGCNWDGMGKFFQCDLDFLQDATQEELEKELVGKSVTEYAFMSVGSSKGRGFSDKPILMNIYAPEGTKAMYIEPISQYGSEGYEHGFGMDWDGEKTPSRFGIEVETLFQQGTTMRITRVEKRYNGFYVDMEVIDQSTQQRWVPNT